MNKFKVIKLKSDNSKNLNTELLFEIASARAENCEILRLEFDLTEQAVVSYLKKMKNNSMIQFYATADSFEQSDTKAVFLLNKYPDIFTHEISEISKYIYVKL